LHIPAICHLPSAICHLSSLIVLLALPLSAQQTLSPFQEQKARALLKTQLPCLGCHELDGDGGKVGPSFTTVGTRRSAAYIRAMVEDPQRRVPGSAMPRTLMAESTREVVIRFLSRNATAPDTPPLIAPPVLAAAKPFGTALYARWCASCHGAQGKGDGANAKAMPVPPAAHANAAAMRERPDDSLYDTIAGGGIVMGRSARMPAFGATLSREEIRALVAHIRSLCACQEPAWARRSAGR
jgi:mono/diheme cytochrome c family protein